MSYDSWKTRSPDDELRDADGVCGEDEPTELDEVYEGLRESQAEAKRLRDALSGLYGLCKLIYVGADPADEIRRVLATNHRSIEAARVLGCDLLDNPKF